MIKLTFEAFDETCFRCSTQTGLLCRNCACSCLFCIQLRHTQTIGMLDTWGITGYHWPPRPAPRLQRPSSLMYVLASFVMGLGPRWPRICKDNESMRVLNSPQAWMNKDQPLCCCNAVQLGKSYWATVFLALARKSSGLWAACSRDWISTRRGLTILL